MREFSSLLQTRRDLDLILSSAYELDASDVHIGADDPIKVRRQGILENLSLRPLNINEVEGLLVASYDENHAATSKVNSGEELDFSYVCQFPCNGKLLRWRVNAGSRRKYGLRNIKLVFRAINSMPPKIESLNVEPEIIKLTTEIRKGLVLVTGATGSGKSTLLAAILRRRAELNAEHMITAEAPIEYVYDDIETLSCITAQEIGWGGDHESFYKALVAALRKDPDVILVGEARDKETISAALHGAQTGHVLFTTCHTNGVANTISRLLKEFPESERAAIQMDIIDDLSLVVYQTLVPDTQGKRIALREYLIFDGEVKDVLRECLSTRIFTECYQQLIKHGQTLLSDAENKLKQGLISDITFRRIKKEFEADVSKYSALNEVGL